MLDDGTANSYFYKLGCAAAFEKVGITLEQARDAYARKDPQFMAWWSHQFSPKGMYHSMSPGLARYIHQSDLKKQRATIPQLAGVFGVDVPKPFQQYADPPPEAEPVPKQAESLDRPEDQTYQVHREVESPAHNGPDGPPSAEVPYSKSTTQDVWNEHDKRVDRQVLPDIDSRTGL